IISTARWCFLPTTSSILDGHKEEGGVSRRSGGRWNPPSKQRDGLSVDEKNDLIFRKARGILNKLTPEKFDKLSLELLNVGIDSQLILKGIILLIFEKALDEPKYSSLYAQLCHRLCKDAPNFDHSSSKTITFRRLLLNKCQDEFENRSRATEAFDKKDGPLNDDEAEQYHLAKQKMLGNIKFIGELGKLEMLHEGILHKCIKQLLEKKKNVSIKDMAEDLECLCQIIRTVGRRLDSVEAKAWMDKYFERIKNFASNSDLPSRIRFMLQDVVELRANKWVPRKMLSDHGPKTISQIRQEAADEFGIYLGLPDGTGRGGGPTGGLFGSRIMNGNMGACHRGGLADIFSAAPTGLLNNIGTGPGVIQADGFLSGYSMNMGRRGSQPTPGNFTNQFNNRRMQDGSGGGPVVNSMGFGMGGVGTGNSPRSVRRVNPPQTSAPSMFPNPQNHHHHHPTLPLAPMQSPLLAQPPMSSVQRTQSQFAFSAPGRDLPQRFMRMTMQPPIASDKTNSGPEDINLRPYKPFNMLRPSVPNMLSKPTRPLIGTPQTPFQPPLYDMGSNPNPLINKQPQITIKQANPEKSKAVKKAPLTKKELDNSMTSLLDDYFNSGDIQAATSAIKDLNAPNKFIADSIYKMMINYVDKSDTEREKVMNLIVGMKPESLVTPELFMEAYRNVLDKLQELETDVPLIKSYVASYTARAIGGGVISLCDLADVLDKGAHYPLFLISLQQMHKQKDKEWLVNVFNESKINLQDMLPEIDQSKEKMMEILEDRGLSFLFPLLRIQSELWKQIQTDPSATAIFKWIKDKVQNDLHQSSGFINILTTSILKYITKSSTLFENCDPSIPPEKHLVEKERDMLDKLKVVPQQFLHDHIDLQVVALYASQVFCYNNNFPKNMLRRFFMHFYDMEIVEEEAFLKWKEDINDEYPGKGKALFQVNQWLTWLEQAEEESEDDDDD
ncbi:eukaryotic translation initiation factor 4 gamma 2, partial [Argonauta hians]